MPAPQNLTEEITDEGLMQAFARGNMNAFERLYDRHETGVWRFVFRSVQDNAVTDDLVQELWFSVTRSAASYEPTAKFKTWLFTMARNRVIDHVRTRKNHASIDAENEEGESMFSDLAAESRLGPMRQVSSREQAKALLDAIEQLPEDQREAFLLQAEGDMSVEEIAVAIGVTFETAKSRLRYARNKLKTLLADFAEVSA
jgi:RNA polymerase sigma factor (sigma-70 family)